MTLDNASSDVTDVALNGRKNTSKKKEIFQIVKSAERNLLVHIKSREKMKNKSRAKKKSYKSPKVWNNFLWVRHLLCATFSAFKVTAHLNYHQVSKVSRNFTYWQKNPYEYWSTDFMYLMRYFTVLHEIWNFKCKQTWQIYIILTPWRQL